MTIRQYKGKGERKYNLNNLVGNPGTVLKSGEVTRTHRMRASPEAQDWFAGLTTVQRGEIIYKLMKEAQANN